MFSKKPTTPGDRQLYPLPVDPCPAEFQRLEQEAIEIRRGIANEDPRHPVVGLALSGGGIRSATFSLGVLQALAKCHLLRRIDYLSTVSGGGYIGSFLGALFQRFWIHQSPDVNKAHDPCDQSPPVESDKPRGANAAARVEDVLHPENHSSKPLRWLRENGHYLSPNGSGDLMLMTAIFLRNWLAVQVVLGVSFLSVFLLADALRYWGSAWKWYSWPILQRSVPGMPEGWIWWSPYMVVPLLILLLGVVPFTWAYWLVTDPKTESAGWFTRRPWIMAAGLGALSLFLDLVRLKLGSPSVGLSAFLAFLAFESALTLLLVAAAQLWSRGRRELSDLARSQFLRNRFSSWLASLLWFFLGCLAFAVIDSLGQTLYAYLRETGFLRGILTFKAMAAASGLAGLLAFIQKIAVMIGDWSRGRRLKLPMSALAAVLSGILLIAVFSVIASLAHGFAWGWEVPYGNPGRVIIQNHPLNAAATPAKEIKEVAVTETPPKDTAARTVAMKMNRNWLLITLGVSLLMSLAFGQTFQFINQSSYAALYSARLTRAYLGASNPLRLKDTGQGVTEVIPCDDLKMVDYQPHLHGGPLHLINVTLNETVSGRSQIEQRDRKGMGMAIGPFGVSVGVRHHSVWKEAEQKVRAWRARSKQPENTDVPAHFRLFQEQTPHEGITPEPLGLGQWVGISGAAFSTGLGSRTSLGLSLLCGMANIRLGYWWNSGVDPKSRNGGPGLSRISSPLGFWLARWLPVQMYLIDEFTARFHGPARKHWYLSDGGHFENTACYELIRRRLPLMIACDNGCDTDYEFSDLANLVRKARIDFNAEITFINDDDLLKKVLNDSIFPLIGPLDQLRRGKLSEEPPMSVKPKDQKRKSISAHAAGLSFAHASLAKICYDGRKNAESILLLIKPTLVGKEPVDLLEYHASHPDFPQESTLDQYFDEGQWESYRKLGEWIGLRLFEPVADMGKWQPGSMTVRSLLEQLNHAVE